MLLNFYLYYRIVLLGFHCKRQLRSTMSGSTEPSQLLMSVKNIKEESDHFLQEYLFEIQTVEEKPELEHDCKTETHTSPTLTCKEENSSLMEIKEEEESDHFLQEYLFEIQTVEEKPELEHDRKTEMHTSPTLTCKEENSSLMEMKEEPDLRECADDDSSTSKLLNSWFSRIQIELIPMFCVHLLNTEWLANGFTCALLSM